MRRINQILWSMAAAMYPVVVPTVVGITSAAQTEGGAITHTVTLNTNVLGMPAVYPISITSITASAGSDYNATPTFGSSGVTLSGGNITVPVGVLSFPIIVATSQDTVYEGTESYSITVGGMTNTVNILDDDAAPTVLSVSSASASEGNSVIHLITISGTAQAARTFAISFTDGTATGGGVDYTSTLTNANFTAGVTISGGNISVPPSVTSAYCYVPTSTDALTEGSETYTLTVGGASGVGTITDGYGGPVVYGAPADAGQIDTAWAAPAWSGSIDYVRGDKVANGGSTFFAILPVPAGTPTSNTTYWTPVSTYYYFDPVSGLNSYNTLSQYAGFITNTDGSQGSTNAAYGPAQTLAKLYDYTVYLNPGNVLTAPNNSTFTLARGATHAGFVNFGDVGAGYGTFELGAHGTGARPVIQFEHNALMNTSSAHGIQLKYANARASDFNLDMRNTMSFQGTAVGTFNVGETLNAPSGATGIFMYTVGTNIHMFRLTSFPTQFATGETVTGVGITATASGATCVVGTKAYPTGVIVYQTGAKVANAEIRNVLGEAINLGNSAGNANYVTIDGVLIEEACLLQYSGAAIAGESDGASITRTTIKNGGCSNTSHNMYFNNFRNFRIARCHSYMGSVRGNHALVLHDVCHDGIIEENLFDSCQNGIGINDGHSTIESFTNIVVRRNINRNHGKIPGQGQGQAFELSCLVDSEFCNNLSYNCGLGYNIMAWRNTTGGDSLTTNTRFSHETIYNLNGGVRFTGTMGALPNTLQNTIIMSTGTDLLLTVDAAAYPKTVVRNLLLYAPNNTGNVVLWNGTYYTLANWMTAFGNALGCINANPLFVDAAGGDFRLQAGSPAKLAGYNSGITTDFDGNARHATTPSIGAYE